MPDVTSKFLDALTTVAQPPFSLRDVEGFPYSEYAERLKVYTENEGWYSGTALDATKDREGSDVELYPVKINPLKSGVQKHAFSLFGEVEEDDNPLVSPKFIFTSDAQKKLADKAEDVLSQVWWESNGRAIQWQNGGVSQIYGGCIFKLTYDPFDTLRSIPLRIDIPHPKYFIGVPQSSDMFRLREAWIVKPITQQEAKENGYTLGFSSSDEVPWLIEHWTNLKYNVWINTQSVQRYSGTEWVPVSDGTNPFGFVPVVYIPHIRIDGFYGENMFDHVRGIIKELNLRVADFGDAVNADAHAYMAMRNVQGSPDVKTLAPNVNAINLGNALALAGNESVPDLWDLRKERASEAMATLVDSLYDQYRRDAFIPKVADGEDEGSQRSGLTLAMRMLSLLWHTQTERVFWTSGLNLLNRMALRILAIKEPDTGITIEHASLRMKQDWSPVLPRDREMLVNEVVARMSAKIISPETAFDIFGDVQDADEEKKAILDFIKKLAEAENVQKPVAVGTSGRTKVSGGTPTTTTQKTSSES